MEIKDWGKIDNQKIYLYTLTNANGMRVSLSNIGAASNFFRGEGLPGVS